MTDLTVFLLQVDKNRHKLYCHYLTNNSPHLMISPAKEEILHLNPFLAVYHNIISDYEIAAIKSLAMPKVNFFFII